MEKILIIDDSPVQANFLSSILEPDYEITVVNSAEEGLEQAKAGDYSLILLDVIMPGIDGFTVCKRLREQDKSIGIIMLSAKSQEMDKVNCQMQGADD